MKIGGRKKIGRCAYGGGAFIGSTFRRPGMGVRRANYLHFVLFACFILFFSVIFCSKIALFSETSVSLRDPRNRQPYIDFLVSV